MVKGKLISRKEKIDRRDSSDQSDGNKMMRYSLLGKVFDGQYFYFNKTQTA